jgi:hypothetical protein
MTEILDFLKEFNIQNILSMGLIMWYFTRDIKSSIDRLDKDLQGMNTRVSRLEGTVYKTELYKGE